MIGHLFLILAQELPPPCGEEWATLPTRVVDSLPGDGESWKTENGRANRDGVRVEVSLLEPESVEVRITDFNSCHGTSLTLRLTHQDGGLHAQARSTWATDIGPRTHGPNEDLHGLLRVEEKPRASGQPLRLSFRLHGIEGWCGPGPRLTEGQVEVHSGRGDAYSVVDSWDLRTSFGPRHGPPCEVSETRADGSLRASGWIDPAGLRQGTWTTWYDNGAVQSRAEFRDGERLGEWTSFWNHGQPHERGGLTGGVRTGEWTEWWGRDEQLVLRTGRYADGVKHGRWIARWADGSPKTSERYEHGLPAGVWTGWWPNGNKRFEGERGWLLPEGVWSYWNEDGSLKERKDWSTP